LSLRGVAIFIPQMLSTGNQEVAAIKPEGFRGEVRLPLEKHRCDKS
jgi:hypothetical protein